jgi:hypothetical protein
VSAGCWSTHGGGRDGSPGPARVRLLFTRERMCAADDVYSQLMGLEPDAMALVPLVAAAGFLVGEVRQHGLPAVVALALAAADGRGRRGPLRAAGGVRPPGPGEVAEGSLYVGAYRQGPPWSSPSPCTCSSARSPTSTGPPISSGPTCLPPGRSCSPAPSVPDPELRRRPSSVGRWWAGRSSVARWSEVRWSEVRWWPAGSWPAAWSPAGWSP